MTAQNVSNKTTTPTPDPPTPRRPKAAQTTSGVAFATAEQLVALGGYLTEMTNAAKTYGWHSHSMVVAFGDDEESIIVGVRWIGDQYHAEIR